MPTKRLVVRRKPVAQPPARSPSKTRKVTSATSPAASVRKPVRTAPSGRSKAAATKAKSNGVATVRKFRGGTLDTAPARSGSGLWGLRAGSTRLRFLSEPMVTDDCGPDAAMQWFEEAYLEDEQRYVVLTDDMELPEGARRTMRYVAAAYDKTEDAKSEQVKYFKLPSSLIKAISKQFSMYQTICDVDCYIEKEGTRLNTSYTITFERNGKPVRNLESVREALSVPDAIDAEAVRVANQPAKVKKYSRRELLDMDLPEFKKLARSLDIPAGGRARRDVIDDILEAQD